MLIGGFEKLFGDFEKLIGDFEKFFGDFEKFFVHFEMLWDSWAENSSKLSKTQIELRYSKL